jgi:eukaryotic-like serine/threonine-protein kinase
VSTYQTLPVGPGVALVDGRYRLERLIGTGGMASVWLGRDQRLDRPVAVKVLSDTLAADPEYVERFRREARLAAGLSHPNLVKVFDFEPEGRPALVMEYVDCGTLEDTANRPETAVEAETLAAQLLGALEHIHGAGIVHRDIKPANVLIGKDDRALLTDFGIAQPEDATRVTQTGQVIGTVAYMAPEVLDGERATPRSDLYSCGVLLRDYLDEDSPPGLVQLVERLTERDPSLRPASAAKALAYLAGAVPSATGAASRAAVTTKEMTAPPPPADEAAPDAQPPPEAAPVPARPTRSIHIGAGHVLGALIALAAAIGVIVMAFGDGGEDGTGGESPGSAQSEAGAPAEGQAASSAIPEPKGGADSAEGVALNDEGFQLIQSGDYDEAVKVLRKAVASFPGEERTSLEYGYALFNYGQALRLAGRPEEAIPVLEARLEIPDQIETVQAELDQARAEAGG